MRDVVEFSSPGGVLGRIVDALFLRRYLERLIAGRAEVLREEVERRSSGDTVPGGVGT